jgi:hypothetical protein
MVRSGEEITMRKNLRRFVALACFAIALSGAALAQDLPKAVVRANIPFDFYAGDQKLPAGVYTMTVLVDRRITLRNQETGVTCFLMSIPADAVAGSKASLIFDEVPGAYLLHSLEDNSVNVNFFENKALLAAARDRGTVTVAVGE